MAKPAREGTRPHVTVLAGPTAVGKGTVAAAIRRHAPSVWFSVSATTRPPRPTEVEGLDYFFVNSDEFDRMIADGELLEWALVHNQQRSGTPRRPVEQAIADGRSVLLEIDLQGARQVRQTLSEAQFVFLAPPSWSDLEARLTQRGTEGAAERARRLETAKRELLAIDEFDHVIINHRVAQAANELLQLMGEDTVIDDHVESADENR